jgi:hypothetical protein
MTQRLTSILFPTAAVLLAASMVAGPAAASEPDRQTTTPAQSLGAALTSGELSLDLRYRFEWVDDDDFDRDAKASTLRSAISYETASFRGLFAGVSLEAVTPVGNDRLYNNGGSGDLGNGVTDRPTVADPELAEIDRLYLGYRGRGGFEILAGRKDLILDNQRFVGIAPWRQNFRSYDLAHVAIGSERTLRAQYAYLDAVNYNSGASPALDGHVLHLSRDLGFGLLSAYGYLLDWESPERWRLSSATYGARLEGEAETRTVTVSYFGEYARQSDHGDNPEEFELDYAHAGVGVGRGPWTVELAWELRDGDGVSSVQSPLGTNHGKNGFADRMVINPPDGSEDLYLRLRHDRERWGWLVAFHDFSSARTGDTLGQEVDAAARYAPFDTLSLHLKIAHYMADTYRSDVTKAMVWASWSFDHRF